MTSKGILRIQTPILMAGDNRQKELGAGLIASQRTLSI